MNGLTPETIQALLKRKIITPEQAKSATPQVRSPAGAVLNGQPTNVAGDAVLGSPLPPIGSGQSPITPYRPPQQPVPQPPNASVPMRPNPSGSPAPTPSGASINGNPVATVGDLDLSPTAGVPPGFQSHPLPSFAQMGAAMSRPGAGPPIDYTNPDLQEAGIAAQQAPQAPQAPSGPQPQAAPVAESKSSPTPADQADVHFRQNAPGANGNSGGALGIAPLRTVPAHTVSLVDPEVASQERRGLEQESSGRVGEAQGDVGANESAAKTYGNQAGQEMVNEVQANSKARHIRWIGDQHAKEMETDRLELQKAKPDYNRVFRGRPLLGAMAAIAQGFGAAGSALTHSPNQAANILSDFVDRDVAQQRADYEQKKESLAAKQSIYAEKMKLLGDPNAAEEAAKAHGYNAMTLLAKREATLANSPVLQARVTTTEGLMGQKIAEKTAAMQQRVQAATVGGMGNGGGVKSDLYVPRAGGSAKTEAEATELRKAGGAYATLETTGKRALALRAQLTPAFVAAHPVETYNIHKELGALQAEAQHSVQEISGFRRLSDKDAQINVEQLGNMTGWSPGTSERLQQFLGDKKREEQQTYEARGVDRGVSGYRRDAQGNIVPAVALTGEHYEAPRELSERKSEQ